MRHDHTPGPWATGAWSSHGIIIFKKNQNANDTFIGYAQGYPHRESATDEDRTHFLSEPDAEANARLIAAAPDLLIALQELISAVQDAKRRWIAGDNDGINSNMVVATVKQAEQAVLKAGGWL